MYKFILPALLLFAGVGTSCLSEQVDLSPDSGNFQVLATDLNDDDVWALNRSITLTFNNPIDPDSVGFHSVVIRPLDNNQVSGQPVTGMFELLADGYGNADQAIRFWPACASHSESGGDGGLIAGGVDYELLLPTSSDASAVLRDTAGHPLSLGLRRTFRTPIPPAEETYLDLALGPLHILAVDFPERLNLFTEGEPSDVVVTFDQDLEPGISNLNSDSLWLEYTLDAAFGSSPDETKRVPVRYFLLGNCAPTAVQVVMRPLGILPPDALFRVVMAPTLRDLSGETNSLFSFSAESRSESLLDLYNTTAPVGDESMVDEFMDNFLDTSHIDLSATLYAPQASPRDGAMHASMSFPGEAVAQDKNFWLGNNEVKYIDTDGVKTVTDSNQEVFPVNDGVLYLNNLTIEAGATLRGQGSNPLQIYVVGDIFVYGTIDVSGDPAPSTVTGNRPDQPEYGASGQCGGGAGGSASLDISQETFFGENGFSPFGLTLSQGGQGGEGGYQRYDQLATPSTSNLLVGGGGGGAFAGGPNEAVFFAGWFGALNPDTFDNAGPDLNSQRHTAFLHNDARSFAMFQGAEQGLRGAGGLLDIGPMGGAGGTYGMELGDRMQDPADDDDTWDPAWTSADPTPPFELGHPTDGPDGGAGGVDYASAEDCFFGRQFIYLLDEQSGQAVQSVKDGALLTPWAGAGGGASGDSHTVIRKDLDGDTVLDDVGNFWPDPEFPTGTTGDYYKGAPGGGGGGQLLLMSLGGIVFGESSSLLACGGSGAGGESTSDGPGLGTTTQISGSGGGSGGHIVLHSSTGIDFSAIPLAGLGNWADPDNFLADASASSFALRAIGGRRGWAFSSANSDLIGGKDGYDGNGTYQAGRGGAGGNGVIQIHVPNPLTDIIYHPSVEVDINNYLTAGDPTAPFAFTDRLSEVLGLFSVPQSFSLVPMYSAESQFQSEWIDTGLAYLRAPNALLDYPIFSEANSSFVGIDPAGLISREDRGSGQGNFVVPGAVVMSSQGVGSVSAFEVTLPTDDLLFAVPKRFLRTPNLLVGYDFYPSAAVAPDASYEITSALYDSSSQTMTLSTLITDGSMALLAGPTPDWEIRAKFFRLDTSGVKDRLPDDVNVKIEFQGAAESAAGTNSPDALTAWVTDMSALDGSRFFRYRVTFDLDAQGVSVDLNYEEPSLGYIKVPFGW